jgi:hypothetical protein
MEIDTLPARTPEELLPPPPVRPVRLWVRPAHAAELIDCSLSRIYELMENGRLRNTKIDGMRLIAYESIERLGE